MPVPNPIEDKMPRPTHQVEYKNHSCTWQQQHSGQSTHCVVGPSNRAALLSMHSLLHRPWGSVLCRVLCLPYFMR